MKYRFTFPAEWNREDLFFESDAIINGGDSVHLGGVVYATISGPCDVFVESGVRWFAVYDEVIDETN